MSRVFLNRPSEDLRLWSGSRSANVESIQDVRLAVRPSAVTPATRVRGHPVVPRPRGASCPGGGTDLLRAHTQVICSTVPYDAKIDVWAVGCIFAELLGRKPLFDGRDYVEQVDIILDVLGTPSGAHLRIVLLTN